MNFFQNIAPAIQFTKRRLKSNVLAMLSNIKVGKMFHFPIKLMNQLLSSIPVFIYKCVYMYVSRQDGVYFKISRTPSKTIKSMAF